MIRLVAIVAIVAVVAVVSVVADGDAIILNEIIRIWKHPRRAGVGCLRALSAVGIEEMTGPINRRWAR